MPQMMPLNWVTLLIIFNLMFYFMNNIMYYTTFYKNNKLNLYKNKFNFKWKW